MEQLDRKICRSLLFVAVSTLLLGPSIPMSAQSAAEKVLLAKAQSLSASGYLDMAVQTWQQVLMADPNNQEALLGIARADMQSGKTNEARKYLERLRAAGGNTAAIEKIQAMEGVEPQSVRLGNASRLAQSGRYAEAMGIYRSIYGDNPPAGNYALAYYDTEAAIPEDREHAIEGLRRLSKQFPADPRYAVTLGRVLTYDPKTRPEGLTILRQYDGLADAQSALRQAEKWNVQAESAAPAATPKQLPSAGNPLEGQAYRALNGGHLDAAKQQFQILLDKQPNNIDALSGMGYVSMKQQDFVAASSYFERARSLGARGLETAITSAHFWAKMAQASSDLKSGNTESAAEGYRSALSLEPSNADALEGLGSTLLQAHSYAEAASMFDRAVRGAPQRTTAWRGLFFAQSSAGSSQAAIDTSNRMPKSVHAQLASDPDYLRVLVENEIALGEKAEADRVIEQALSLPFPNQGRDLPADKQIQYAGLLMTAKRHEPAIRLYRQALAQDPENTAAWLALIAAEHQLQQDDDALATIGSMPQPVFDREQKDAGFLALVGSIYQTQHEWTRAQKYLETALSIAPSSGPGVALQLADVYAAQGNEQRAYAIYRRELDQHPDSLQAWRGLLNVLHQANHDSEALRQLSLMPEWVRLRLELDPSYLQTLASVQVATGQEQSALTTFAQLSRLYADQNTDVPVDAQIQYGWALLKAGADSKLYSIVSKLANSSEMTPDQRVELSRLWASWSVQRANSALDGGDPRRALAILEAALQIFPKNPDIYNALAGAYLKTGQPRQAVAIYSTFDMSRATLLQYRGAIGAALAARDMKHAETWLQNGLDRYKNDPEILKMAAQYEEARGDSRRAAAYYRAALDAMSTTPAGDPFSRLGAQNGPSPTQQLMRLLAPDGHASLVNGALDSEQPARRADASWQDAPGRDAPTVGDLDHSDQGEMRTDSRNAADQRTSTLNDFSQSESPGSGMLRTSAQPNSSVRDRQTNALPDDSAAAELRPATRNFESQHASLALERDGATSSVDNLQSTSSTSRQLRDRSQDMDFHGEDRFADNPNPAGSLQTAVRELSEPGGNARPLQEPAASVLPEINGGGSSVNAGAKSGGSQFAALPPLAGSLVGAEQPKTEREQVEEKLAIMQGAASGWIGGSSTVDYRSGQPGYDRLANYTGEVEGSGTLGPGLRTTVITRPVLLDSGEPTSSTTFQQGTLPAGSVPYLQSAAGVGGEFQVRAASFGASLGYTPHGFLIENVTGSLYVQPPSSHFTLTFMRAPILDTQLSYAGLRDLGSQGPTYPGNIWGGVISNAGELQVAAGDNRAGWYIQGGGQYITGYHVQDNKRLDGDAGAYWTVWKQPEYGTLSLGMNFFGMHYDHNLRYFTYGQGGYFSPAAYMLAGIPFTFVGHRGPGFHYRVTGSLGVQAFQEDSTPYYPLDPAIQALRNNPYYPESTNVGGNYSLNAEGSYAIAEHWYVGGNLNFNNTRDYASESVGFFMRYLFRPQPPDEETGPTGLFPPEGLRPLRVP